ncbi:MAG TPA: fumarylacetoacetate hydrolase family protein, partial [Ilumatobacteraceae bacterium]|nr:fumarylacetoacetate hydrolase family protein [Ilumatobacteraceae bacterium]
PRRPEGLDLRLLGVVMQRNGEVVGTAAGAAVMGHPAASVVALVRWLADSGQALPAGSLVMTGGVTEALSVHAGDHVTARVQDLGTVGVRFA